MRSSVLFGLFLVAFCAKSESTHCDKELNYHGNYGYGIDVLCDGITSENVKILKEISVSNEILLDLQNCNLSVISTELFAKLDEIRVLTIANSSLTFYNETDKVLEKFTRLEHLIISDSVLKSDRVLTLPNNLKELNLTNTSLMVNSKIMSNLRNLDTLTISRNNLSTLSLCDLKLLKVLHLSHNSLKNNSFLCPVNLELTEIDLSYNELEKLHKFPKLLKLKHLNLEGNKIREITKNLFEDIPNIEKVNLNSNFLEDVDDVFVGLKTIKKLELRGNKLEKVRIENNPNLLEINLMDNKITFDSIKHLKNLPKLRNLNMSRNNLIGLLVQLFSNFENLESLDLSYNRVILDNFSFFRLRNLVNLNIRGNNFEKIPSKIFENLNRLKTLDLSNNNLKEIESRDTFKDLINLEVLDMSNNLLEGLDYEILKFLKNLQILDIAGNRLKHFQYDLVNLLPSLAVINIKNNNLPCDILTNIIVFLKHEHVNFTINEELDYSRQNVAGIYCTTPSNTTNTIRYGFGLTFLVIVLILVAVVILYKFLLYSKRRHYLGDEIELIES